MIEVRPYRPEDRPRLFEIHQEHQRAHGIDYQFADPDNSLQFETLIAQDGDRIVAGVSARLTCEGMLTLDTAWGTPALRWAALRKLYTDGAELVYGSGLREIHACLPANQNGYARRLQADLGFTMDPRLRLVLDLESVFGTSKETPR